MARLNELGEWERELMLIKLNDLKPLDAQGGMPWVSGPALNQRRVAIVTSAGIHRADDQPFADATAAGYRIIPGDEQAKALVMSHLSSNFDRTGFQQDINVVFPIDRLHELAAERVIGSVAAYHYAFNGSTPTPQLEPHARQLAGLLKKDKVDAVLLTPV
jgi:D-proline reductase (dithiol) PrdB